MIVEIKVFNWCWNDRSVDAEMTNLRQFFSIEIHHHSINLSAIKTFD